MKAKLEKYETFDELKKTKTSNKISKDKQEKKLKQLEDFCKNLKKKSSLK